MTKITLTWQGNALHFKPFNEEVEISTTELESNYFPNNVASAISIKRESTKPTPHRLQKLEASAIIVAFDDCILQLSIIKCMLNENIRPSWNNLFKYQSVSERFESTPKRKQLIQEEVYEKVPYTDHQKLQKDICFLVTTLTELCREISQKGDYKSLLSVLGGVKQEEEDNEELETCRLEHETELARLKKTLIQEENELSKEIEEANQRIAQLQIEFEENYFLVKEELRYTEDWDKARVYQNELRLTLQEDEYTRTISNNLANIEYENRIHNEVRDFIQENSEDLQNSINYWMQHYDDEIERRDSAIIKLNMTWGCLTEDHRVLKATYEDHTAFVVERRAINEERRILAEILRVQTAAAIKIQACWRGTMVRKKLGPFRVKKKGKKEEKGKKVKNGKKKK